MTALVLDSEAFNLLTGQPSARSREMAKLVKAASEEGAEVVVPTVLLAELYRPGRSALVDALLARKTGSPHCRDTDRPLARVVGSVLGWADAGSEHLADAHVVAVAAEYPTAVIATGDPDDITRLAAPFPTIQVVALP